MTDKSSYIASLSEKSMTRVLYRVVSNAMLAGRSGERHCEWGMEHLINVQNDLLAACENLENDDGSIPDHAWQMIQAAVAKAKGE